MTRGELVPRRRLITDLAAVRDDVPLILLVAPPGYGKSIALRQWAARDQRSFAWVTAEPADRDPHRLLRRIARAIGEIHPVEPATWRSLSAPASELAGEAVPRLAATAPEVLVIDDVHLLRGTPGQQLVLALAESLPTGSHLAIGARSRLGLPVGGLRSQGRCAEFGPSDLRLSRAEAINLIRATGTALPAEQALGLNRRFEGWPAGVYLAALSLRGRSDAVRAAGQVTGADAYLSEYFREVVLAAEPADTVRFLLRSATLDTLSGGVCDAVLRRHGSGQLLAGLAVRNLFVAPIHPASRSYRYHPVFREMLLAELRRREPAAEPALHRRAATWFERRDQAEPAVRHAAAAGDTRATTRLVLRHGRGLINEGRAGPVADALDGLGRGAVEQDVRLAARAGWVYAFAGRTLQAGACLTAATGQAAPDAKTAAAVERLRAALAPGGVDGMLGSARRAARAERPGSPWYATTMVLLGVAEGFTGNTVLATARFARAARTGAEYPVPAALALAGLAWHAADQHDCAASAAYAEESAALLGPGSRTYGWAVMTHLVRARVALETGDATAFRLLLGEAAEAMEQARPFPWLVAAASLRLSRVTLDAGDHTAASKAAVRARLALDQLTTTGVLAERYRALTADLGRESAADTGAGTAGLTAAEQRVLLLLPTHLTLNQIAGELRLSRNTVKTQVAAVYRKLSASTRAAAVVQGRELGLLD
ncbi:AAA family ATPase [Paractinoplanes atraurantiacus]|uniref:LuxR family transcriptional regulator, maltose regulon positive regulatory protein n=1 Tax=Paractinoplanes atraurantiacus TaxID=1036182 RepID=A0A285IY45_9ACTN|nr:AAA family ATPase [Actinoplanes atraurantiacus]SNY52904.1 LuxR family transcriptional regulator, maltose regulon positive regulatory protein [Actinoplanes atraurantiacus]